MRARADAGKFAGARIAAGCLDQQPERRAAHERAGNDQHAGDDDHGNRQAKHAAIAEPDQLRRGEGDDASLGDELGNAPARDHQDQRGDDRLNAEDGDKECRSTGRTDRPAPSAAREHQRQRMAIGKARRDGARRSPSPRRPRGRCPGGDHQHHAERQQRHRRAAIENVDQAAEQAAILQAQVEELRRDRAVDQENDDERENWARPRRGRA